MDWRLSFAAHASDVVEGHSIVRKETPVNHENPLLQVGCRLQTTFDVTQPHASPFRLPEIYLYPPFFVVCVLEYSHLRTSRQPDTLSPCMANGLQPKGVALFRQEVSKRAVRELLRKRAKIHPDCSRSVLNRRPKMRGVCTATQLEHKHAANAL